MEDRESIKKHYNQIPNRSVRERNTTQNVNIRNANNTIKSYLIRSFVKSGDQLLDIGVGKGGDFKKYHNSRVKEVYGLDIANRSLLDALNRARESFLCFKLVLKIKDCFTTRFDLKKEFDVISVQFSFHYCFACEEYVDITLDNIERHLKPSGHLLITIPCKDTILKRVADKNQSNKFYSIRFKDESNSNIYGRAYYYTLVDSVHDCVEYLVDVPELTRKAQEKGLYMIENVDFKSFYEENILLYPEIPNSSPLDTLSKEEEDVVSLHRILVFKKEWLLGNFSSS